MVAEGVFVMGLLTSYCTAEDVLRLLAGYDLSRLGTTDEVTERIRQLLGPTRCGIDAEAGRDFLFHADDEISVDGRGGDRVMLAGHGVSPVEDVQSLWVNEVLVSDDEYVNYGTDGTIRLKPGGSLGGMFPVGVQNVRIALDWGYTAPPSEISLAQAKLIGAQILAEMAGERGSLESLRLGDYSVTYDAGGEHAGTITRWVMDARRAAGLYRSVRFAAV